MTDLVTTLRQEKYKVLLIGDSCLDHYIYGTVDRLSPEAPIPILKANGREQFIPGMSDNVYHNLLALQCEVDHIKGSQSIKKRYIDERSGYQLLRVDLDANDRATLNVNKLDLTKYNAVVISDYNKGFVDYKVVQDIRNKFVGPIFVDTKKLNLSWFDGCFLKINFDEFTNAISFPNNHKDYLIVTRGSEGTLYKNEVYPTEKVEVHDVTGAGDVYLAALSIFYLFTGSIENAIEYANKLATISVQHRGVYTVTEKDINSL